MQHLTDQEIQMYKSGSLSPETLLKVDDHLSLCGICRSKTADALKVRESMDSLTAQIDSTTHHLSYKQLAQWIDGQINPGDKEALGRHLEVCEQCAAEITDLRNFAQSRKAETKPLGVWNRRLSLTRLQAAAAIAIIGSAGLAVVWTLQSRIDRLRYEIQHSQSELADLRKATTTQATTILSLRDGKMHVILDANGSLTGLPPVSPNFLDSVTRSLHTLRLNLPPVPDALTPPQGKFLGGSGEALFSLIYPYGAVVLSDRPEFRWQALHQAKTYSVAIYDSSYQEILRSDALFTSSWIPPKALQRGQVYSWQVTAEVNGQKVMAPTPPAIEARFKVLDTNVAEKIEEAKASAGNSHLLLGVLYAESGLLAEAEKELEALQLENPGSPVPAALLQQVRNSVP